MNRISLLRHLTIALFTIPVLMLVNSCYQNEITVPTMSSAYLQYQPLIGDFRPLQDDFELTDYVFESGEEPERYTWASDTNPNYVDPAKMADLVDRGKVQKLTIRSTAGTLVPLRYGYHVITDGGPNPATFWLKSSNQPLIWINSNYAYSTLYAEVRIFLKNYPPNYDLKFWYFGGDVIDPTMTAQEITRLFESDNDGSDYDAGFVNMPAQGRSFRVPLGIGYLIVKTPANTYQVARVDIGREDTVTFTLP